MFYREKVENPTIDCSKDEILTEQSHKSEVDINNIVKRHGIDLIQQTAALAASTLVFDDVTGNDYQEAMNKVIRAQDSFARLPSQLRARFNNDAAQFLDFIIDPKNMQEMRQLGLANPEQPAPQPVRVEITNPVTPPV